MPTDEQRMRDAFEDIRVAEYGILSVDRDPETGEYARRSTYEAWGNFIGGWLARDAEVQALREMLVEVTRELSEEVTGRYNHLYGNPIHPAMERDYQRDIGTVHRVRDYLRLNHKGEANDAD